MTFEADSLQVAVFGLAEDPFSENAHSMWVRYLSDGLTAFNTLAPGHTSATGIWSDSAVEIQVQAGRVDLILGPLPGASQRSTIPDVSVALSNLLPIGKKIAQQRISSRLAVVVQTSEIVQTQQEAVDKIIAETKFSAPVGSVDIQIQINVPIKSEILPNTDIHRLCRWGPATQVLMMLGGPIQFSPQGQMNFPPMPQVQIMNRYYDVFNAQGTLIPPDKAEGVFEEIKTLVLELVKNGYSALH